MKSLESKKKKLVLTSFYHLSREIRLGDFHRPIKTLEFRIQKCLRRLQKILALVVIHHQEAESWI